jgi:CRP-like cAMP-binding protein
MADIGRTPLAPMVRKLGTWRRFDEADREAILALPFTLRSFEPGESILAEGDTPTQVCLLRSGYLYRQKVVGSGARQILAIHIPGDIADLHNALLSYADHSVQALTVAQTVMIPREAIVALANLRPRVAMAMWHETLVDGAILREWITRIGRRTAQVRLAHLLCELMVRLRAAGQAGASGYEIPMSQEQLADCTGMTAIHLNRMLMSLERAGAIGRRGRSVTVLDWNRLVELGDFNGAYLHLPRHRSAVYEQAAAE